MEAGLAQQCARVLTEVGPRLVELLRKGRWIAALLGVVQPLLAPLLSKKLLRSGLRKLLESCCGGSGAAVELRAAAGQCAESMLSTSLAVDLQGLVVVAGEPDFAKIAEVLAPERVKESLVEAMQGFVWPFLRSELRRRVHECLQEEMADCPVEAADLVLSR